MDTKPQHSSERAVAWAKGMIERKRAEEKRMVEEYKTNYKLQEAVAKLREKIQQEKNGVTTV